MSRFVFSMMILICVSLPPLSLHGEPQKSQAGFEQYIISFKQEALSKGYDAGFLDSVFTLSLIHI